MIKKKFAKKDKGNKIKKVFISYASQDFSKVKKLVERLKLETELDIWFDEDKILPGKRIVTEMRNGIKRCDKYVICLSLAFEKKALQSWVKTEFGMAMLEENKKKKDIIIPVRLKRGGKLPAELGTRAYADLSTPKRWNKNIQRLVEALKE